MYLADALVDSFANVPCWRCDQIGLEMWVDGECVAAYEHTGRIARRSGKRPQRLQSTTYRDRVVPENIPCLQIDKVINAIWHETCDALGDNRSDRRRSILA